MKDKKTSNTFAGLALSAATGVLVFLSFPPHGQAYLIWFAFVPLYVALLRFANGKAAFGAFNAAAMFVASLGIMQGLPPEMKILALGPFAFAGIAFLFTFWQKDLLTGRNTGFFTVVNATAFVMFEYWRSYLVFGQFGALGMTQYKYPQLIQIASWFGVHGVSLLIVVVNCTLALAAAHIGALGKIKNQLAVNAAVIAALMALNFALFAKPLHEVARVKVAAIQAGYIPEAKSHPGLEEWGNHFDNVHPGPLSRESLRIFAPVAEKAARRGAKIIVWPEEIVYMDPSRTPGLDRQIAAIARKTGAYNVMPFASFPKGWDMRKAPRYTNGLVVYSPQGKIIKRYVKQHRVTMFGIEQGPTGHTSKALDSPYGRLAAMICYDTDYSDVAKAYTKDGAQLFLVPSDDLSGFVTRHHPYMTMFRGVEHRRAFVKADIVQGALITDPKGRILADPPDGLQLAEAEVPSVDDSTPAGWLAPLFCIACTVLFFASVFFAASRKNRCS